MSSILDPPGYVYHHGRGEHLLIRTDPDINRPKYSFQCCLCHLFDALILVLIIGFLVFAFWLCYYLYNNYDS